MLNNAVSHMQALVLCYCGGGNRYGNIKSLSFHPYTGFAAEIECHVYIHVRDRYS